MQPTHLPIPDRAGRGALEQRIQQLVHDMAKHGLNGRQPNAHEFERLSRLLDLERKKFHKLYGVKEHPVNAPLHDPRYA